MQKISVLGVGGAITAGDIRDLRGLGPSWTALHNSKDPVARMLGAATGRAYDPSYWMAHALKRTSARARPCRRT